MKSWKTHSGLEIIKIISGRSNVFLLHANEKSILVDTSTGFMRNRLLNNLRKLNVSKIDYLLLTHTHFDHVANAAEIKEIFNAKVLVHSAEASCLERGKNILPGGTILFTKVLMKMFARRVTQIVDFSPCSPDILIDSVFNLHNLGINAYILPTPGHSKGSLSLIVDNEIALVGDAMFGVFRNSIFPPFADDIKSMIISWGKLLDTGCSIFLPSHGTAKSRQVVSDSYNKRKPALKAENFN